MVRLIGFAVGIVFVVTLMFGALSPREAPVADPNKALHEYPREVKFQQDGPYGYGVFGSFDRAQLQRGYQVFKEVCSGCHGIRQVAFRNLTEIGFTEAEVKALAKEKEYASVDPATGEPTTRTGLPSDLITGPYANDVAARAANNNALPPDLSLMVKARANGAAYVYSLLAGYRDPPANFEVAEGLYYNPYFHSLALAMPQVLNEDGVTYADGTRATVDQMSADVTSFLTWTAEPSLIRRRQAGVATIIFLLILTSFAYLTYRKVWKDLKVKGKGEPAAVGVAAE